MDSEQTSKLPSNKFLTRLSLVVKIILVISSVIIFLAMLATVAMRYILKIDLFGIEELILSVVFWMYFFGGVIGSSENSQISADLIPFFTKNKKAIAFFKFVAKTIEVVVLIFLSIYAFWLVQINFELMPTTIGLKIPYVIPQVGIVLGFILMTFYTLLYFILEAKALINSKKI